MRNTFEHVLLKLKLSMITRKCRKAGGRFKTNINSELAFIVLEPVNNSTDYIHLESYNIIGRLYEKHLSHKVILSHITWFLLNNLKHCITTGKISVFPFWDKIGNDTQFWEIIGIFSPCLGIFWKLIGRITSQKWEHFGNLSWSTN